MAFRSAIRNNLAMRGAFQQQYSLFHSNARVLAPKVVATRVLPQHAQARLKEQDFELIQWPEDSLMPRDKLLNDVKGNLLKRSATYKKQVYRYLLNGLWFVHYYYFRC